MDVGTRVIVPLAINALVGNQRVESKHGEIVEMGPGELCMVKLDNGFRALWVADQLVEDDDKAIDYKDPNSVDCPTCNAPAGEPCQYLNGSGFMKHGWHNSRENVPVED